MNEYTVNPAVSGSDRYFNAAVMYRNQWVGVTDAPRTAYLSVHGPLWKNRMGVGGSVFSDATGPMTKAGLSATYAYHLKLSPTMRLSFALSAGAFQWSVNGNALSLQEVHDIAISNGNMAIWKPDFGAGLRFGTERFHAGFYVPQIANLQAQFFNDFPGTENYLSRHYYLNVGYTQPLGELFAFEGNFLARYATLDMADAMVRVLFKDMVWLGGLYRTPLVSSQDPSAVGVMAGYAFANNLSIAYAYDFVFGSALSSATSGSHEVCLSIRFLKQNDDPVVE